MTQGLEMGTLQQRVIYEGLLFLVILLSGIWLRNAGKPYNNIILTPHKLLSLATAILLFWTIRQMSQATHLGTTALIASVITGLLFIGCIISGALLTTDLSLPAIVPKMHKIIPYLTVLSTAATLYLLVYHR